MTIEDDMRKEEGCLNLISALHVLMVVEAGDWKTKRNRESEELWRGKVLCVHIRRRRRGGYGEEIEEQLEEEKASGLVKRTGGMV